MVLTVKTRGSKPSSANIRSLRRRLDAWYGKNRRRLPWRETRDP